MSFRFHPFLRLGLLPAIASLCLDSTAAPAPSITADAAEAQRLYEHSNDYVANINEGDYSYAYIQFYWKRAQSSIDRVLRVYPDTPSGRGLKAGQLKLGAFDVTYFRDRVLARLEEKRQASVDTINCAIFLCETRGEFWDDARRAGVAGILEALCRQKRWGEALKFPVPDSDRLMKLSVIFRVATRYDQEDIAKQLLATASAGDLPELHAVQGEALALRGAPRPDIATLLDVDSADGVKLAILSGMIERETRIQRAAALRQAISLKDGIDTTHYTLKHLEVRDDIESVARTFFPGGNIAAERLLGGYRAALGAKPAVSAPVNAHLAYLEYLAAFEKFDELETYLPKSGGSAELRDLGELKLIELYAQAGRLTDSERHRTSFAAGGPEQAEKAVLAQFRGQMNSVEVPLVVHEKTLAELPFKDPAVLAQAMMEWSLTPTRSIRGAAPYDSVVQKFAPGFANLLPPKSNAVRDAASTQKPY